MRRRSARIGIAFGLCALYGCTGSNGDTAVSAISPFPAARIVPGLAASPARVRAARAPSGYVGFCKRNPGECGENAEQPDRVAFSAGLWAKLKEVNAVVNAAIQPEADQEHYGVADFWTVPVDGAGDCEDYVLAKRKMLVLLGLPRAALRITVVLDGTVRHAVLTVATDSGDYVLDSLKHEILTTDKTNYVWVERQDRVSSTGWVALR